MLTTCIIAFPSLAKEETGVVRPRDDARTVQDQTTPRLTHSVRQHQGHDLRPSLALVSSSSEEGGAFCSRIVEMLGNGGAYHVGLPEHLLVGEAEDGEVALDQELLAFIVVIAAGGIVVHTAI